MNPVRVDLTIWPQQKNMGQNVSEKLIELTSYWARWRLKSLASQVFAEPFVQVQIKENIKAPRHWPLWGKFTGDRWVPRTKGQ